LLSQLLALHEAHIVLSEVPLLDELLRLPERLPSLTPHRYEGYIRAALRLLGQKRTGRETHLFVKLDSWHVYYYPLLRRLFPAVPMVLLYRSPDAVIASHRTHRGMHAVPGLLPPHLVGMRAEAVERLDFDAYTAQVLTYYYNEFLRISQQDSRAFLLPYQSDGRVMMTLLAGYLSLPLDEAYWKRIEERSGFHAKRPGQVFNEESLFSEVPPYLLTTLSSFERLESKRRLTL
jgi:hypothetical protein